MRPSTKPNVVQAIDPVWDRMRQEAEDIARTCAGWEAHLAMLQAALADAPIPFPFELFKATRETYKGKAAALV